MENLTLNQGIKFTAGDGTGVIDTSNPSGSQGISKTAGHTGFYIQSSVDYTLYFYDGSAWSAHQSIDVSDANYVGGFAFAWDDNTAAYIKTADSSHVVYVFARNTDLKVDSTPSDGTQAADSIVDGTGSLSITSINAQNYYTEALSVANDGTVTFDRTDNNNAYQLKFSGNNITIGSNGSDTITLTGGDEFTSPLTTDGDLFIQSGGADSRLGIGSDGQYLSVSSGAPAWVDFAGSPWTDESDWLSYNNDHAFIEIRDQHTNTFNTTKNFTTGNLLIGNGMTLGGYNHRGNIYYGENHNLGASGIMMNNLIGGRANTVADSNYGVAIGMGNGISGDYSLAIGQQNNSHGTHAYSIGYYNQVGTSSSDRTKSFAFGTNNTVVDDKQMALGFGVSTQWSSAEGVFFNAHTSASQATAGFVKNPDGGPLNFGMGGRNVFEDGYGVHRAGAGAGVFWFHNFGNSRTVEPSITIADAVAMYARERASAKMGLIVRAENGGKTWIGDRIGINDTAPAASLEINGEGSTSATSSFKVNNSAGSTLFEVKDDGTVQANGGSLLGYHSSGVADFNTANQNTFAGSMYNGTVVNVGYLNNIAAGARATLFAGYGHDIDKYVDKATILGQQNRVYASTDSSHSSYANMGINTGALISGYNNYGSGSAIQILGGSNQVWGANNGSYLSVAIGNGIKIGNSSSHARDSFGFGKNLTIDNDDVRNMMLIGYGFSADNSIHTENTPMILFGTNTGRPSIAMYPDPDNQSNATNLIMGSNHVAYKNGTTYPLQGGIGNGCFILHGSNTIAPTVNVPNAVTMYAGSRSYDGNNATVGGKGLIIKGENAGRTYISEKVGINVSHNSAKSSQINEEIEAGLHIFGEGNTDATSAVKVENSDGDVAIEVLNDLVVVMPNLPTSNAGLPSGALWNDGGTVKVA
jgi:hypothetical protein